MRKTHGTQCLHLYSENKGQKGWENFQSDWLKCWQLETTYLVNLLKWIISPLNNGGKLLHKVIETNCCFILTSYHGVHLHNGTGENSGEGDHLMSAGATAGERPAFPRIGSCSALGYSLSCLELLLQFNLFFLSVLFAEASIHPSCFLGHYTSAWIYFSYSHPRMAGEKALSSTLWDSSQDKWLYWPSRGTGPSTWAHPRAHSVAHPVQGSREQKEKEGEVCSA